MKERKGRAFVLDLALAIVVVMVVSAGLLYANNKYGLWVPSSQAPPGVQPASQWFYQTGGPLDLDVAFIWSYDDSSQIASTPNATKLYHADRKTLVGTLDTTDRDIGGSVWAEDGGLLNLVVDIETDTTFYVDKDLTVSNNAHLKAVSGWDYDDDGTVEYCFTYDLTSLPAMTAGETAKNDKVNIYLTKYDSGPALTSVANVTGVSTTAYGDHYTELYISGWTGEGYAVKLNRLYITLPDAANTTYVEDGNLKLMDVKVVYGGSLGTKTYKSTVITWSLANSRWEVDLDVDDINNEFYARLVDYGRGQGATFAKVIIHWSAKFPSSSETIQPTVKFYYIDPAGTTTYFSKLTTVAS